MGYYNFEKDHKIAVKTETEVADIFMKNNKDKIKKIEFNNDNRYDLKIDLIDGNSIKIEVKEDFTCKRTGNVGLEFECRGKLSGISVSEADMYMYKIHEPNGDTTFYLFETNALKKLINDNKYHKIVIGGDIGSNSKNYLFKLHIFTKIGELFYKIPYTNMGRKE